MLPFSWRMAPVQCSSQHLHLPVHWVRICELCNWMQPCLLHEETWGAQ